MVTTFERKPLGQLLLSKGIIKPEHLDRALEEQKRTNHQKLLGELLVELNCCTEDQITEALAQAYGVPYARISPRIADPKIIASLPKEFLEKHQVLPLFLVEGILTVAIPEPANVFLLEEIERVSGYQAQVVAMLETLPDTLFRDRDQFERAVVRQRVRRHARAAAELRQVGHGEDERVVEADFAFLGACYGVGTLGQLRGGVVDRTWGEPIGAAAVTLTEEGLADPLLAGLPEGFWVFLGHKEAVSRLPTGATVLATSAKNSKLRAMRVTWPRMWFTGMPVFRHSRCTSSSAFARTRSRMR